MAKLDEFKADIKALAGHIGSRELVLPDRPDKLRTIICNELWRAVDDGVLVTRKDECHKLLKLSDSPVKGPNNIGIYGGDKDFKRTGLMKRFMRNDGAWFHFSITVGQPNRQLMTLIAYDFELCFSDEFIRDHCSPKFVRFDLNEPEHPNEIRDLRSHMHPGHDDLITPAPVMSPLEILHLFLYVGLVPPTKLRGSRGMTPNPSDTNSFRQ